ncbi:hypothetical protein [Pedobacter nototheniae]|uniref:hypothetical protein n=1 Tax=Pedobacter nototheniae TaxID=2488994 RepID=UPI00292F1195|nr:hypothetical protein [Pedobacter nototheniae]
MFTDAELKVKLENLVEAIKHYPPMDGRNHSSFADEDAGLRSGKVSELTVIGKIKSDGGAEYLKKVRHLLDSEHGSVVSCVGTIHDMRFALIDNETRLLFASTFDGSWDSYINDFATKIPEVLDIVFDCLEGWPGITSPTVKDFIKSIQQSCFGWYVSHPNLTINDITRHEKIANGIDKVLDEASLI